MSQKRSNESPERNKKISGNKISGISLKKSLTLKLNLTQVTRTEVVSL
jgi:hypothetical protein